MTKKQNTPLKTYKVAFLTQNEIKEPYFHEILKNKAILEISDKPDFVFCGIFDKNKFMDYGEKPIRIYFYDENVFPNMNVYDYALGFNDFSLAGRHLHVPYYYMDFNSFKKLAGQNNIKLSEEAAKRKFCNFIYSNPVNGNLSETRQVFCKKLMKYKHVDCPGKVLNNMQDAIEPRKGDWILGKLDFIKNYKFTIAFENSDSIGYTTEKLIHPLLAKSIPIYYGNRDAYKDGFNPKAFINAADFKTLDELVNYIKILDNDDKKYMEILNQPALLIDNVPDWDEKIADFLMNILENGQKYTNTGQELSPFQILKKKSRPIHSLYIRIIAGFIKNPGARKNFRKKYGL